MRGMREMGGVLLYFCATSFVYSGRSLQGLTAMSTGPAKV
jgi:hypothetical protein